MASESKKNKGGQPGNENAGKWTEEKAVELGIELLEWMLSNDDINHVFIKEFLVVERNLYQDVVSYLCEKYDSFSDLIKRAKDIQEMRLAKYALKNKVQPTVAIFCLKNLHNWTDKQQLDHTTDGEKIVVTLK